MDREALLRALPDGVSFAERTISEQKQEVEYAVERFLAAVTAEHREPDLWERFCVGAAINFIRDGYYGSALANLAKALEPPEQRSPDRLKEDAERLAPLNRRTLHARLEEVRREPAVARGVNRAGGALVGGGEARSSGNPPRTALHYGA